MDRLIETLSRRRALWLMGGLAGGLALHGCTQSPTAPEASPAGSPAASSAAPTQSLIASVTPWPGYVGHFYSVKNNVFQEFGLDLQENFFQSASENITAFLAGKTEVCSTTSGDALECIKEDPSIKIIYVLDYSNGSDGIIARGIKSPADLKGKTVAREKLLFEQVLLRAYLAKGGLTEADITIKDLTAGDSAAAFAAGRVDAAVTYEPWMTKAAADGGGEVIFTTKDTNLIADVLAVRQKTIEDKPAEIKAYMQAIDKAVKLANSGDAGAIAATAEKLGVTPEEAKGQMAGVKIFDIAMNKEIAFNSSNPNNIKGNLEINVDTAYDMKIIPEKMDSATLYDDSLVKAL